MLINQPESVTETSKATAVPTLGIIIVFLTFFYLSRSSLESTQLVRSVKATKVIFYHHNKIYTLILKKVLQEVMLK